MGEARCTRVGVLKWEGACRVMARSYQIGTVWPCDFSGWSRLEFCGECVWGCFVSFVFGCVFGMMEALPRG